MRMQNVRKLIEGKPANWELELLQTALEDQFDELNDRWLHAKTGRTAEPAFADWVVAQLTELNGLMQPFMRCLTIDLKDALGPPGQAGDADKILRCVNALAEVIDHAIAWEQSVSLFALDPRFSDVVKAMSGMSKPYLDVVNELRRRLRDQIPNLGKTGQIDLSLNMAEPPNLDAFTAALDKLTHSSTLNTEQ